MNNYTSIKDIQEELKNLIKNCELVINSECSVLTQSNDFHKQIADAVNTEIGFCIAILFNGVNFFGVEYDNTDAPPKAEYKFCISTIHKSEYTEGMKDPIEVVDEMLKIHNTVSQTSTGRNIYIKLVPSPVSFIITEPYNIYEIEIIVRTH